MDHRTREVISCDYFLDALADPDFAPKIRERHPEDLDSALDIALQLEVWKKDSVRLRDVTKSEQSSSKEIGMKEEWKTDTKKVREVTKMKMTSGQSNEDLKKEMDGQKKKIAVLEEKLAKMPAPKPPENSQGTKK